MRCKQLHVSAVDSATSLSCMQKHHDACAVAFFFSGFSSGFDTIRLIDFANLLVRVLRLLRLIAASITLPKMHCREQRGELRGPSRRADL